MDEATGSKPVRSTDVCDTIKIMTSELNKCDECKENYFKNLKCSSCDNLLYDNYKCRRQKIFCGLLALLIIIIMWIDFDFESIKNFLFNQRYIVSVFAGLFGLFLRNLHYLVGDHPPEKKGKYLETTYIFQYIPFIILSSALIFAILSLNTKIENQSNLFYAFAVPLNIFIGLEAYRSIEFLIGLIFKQK